MFADCETGATLTVSLFASAALPLAVRAILKLPLAFGPRLNLTVPASLPPIVRSTVPDALYPLALAISTVALGFLPVAAMALRAIATFPSAGVVNSPLGLW